MDIARLTATTLLGTEFIKRLFLKIRIEIKGISAIILSILVSIFVVLYEVLMNNIPLDFNLLIVLIQVIIYSNTGHYLIRKKEEK